MRRHVYGSAFQASGVSKCSRPLMLTLGDCAALQQAAICMHTPIDASAGCMQP
jgi:hypothetical protein